MPRDASVVHGDQTFGSIFVTESLGVHEARQDAGSWGPASDDSRHLTLHLGIDTDGDDDFTDSALKITIVVRDPALVQDPLPNDVSRGMYQDSQAPKR